MRHAERRNGSTSNRQEARDPADGANRVAGRRPKNASALARDLDRQDIIALNRSRTA